VRIEQMSMANPIPPPTPDFIQARTAILLRSLLEYDLANHILENLEKKKARDKAAKKTTSWFSRKRSGTK
jgi:hypothetical protein